MSPQKRINGLVIAGLLLILPLAGVAETITLSDGTIAKGKYVKDKQHGKWIFVLPDGGIIDGKYVYDKEHGKWLFVSPDGEIQEKKYVYGKLKE